MKSKEFIQALRKVIREEVQLAVRMELSNITTVLEENDRRIQYSQTLSKPRITAKKKFSNNNMLNDILNDTAGFSTNSTMLVEHDANINYNDFSEWPSMNSRPMTAARPVVMSDINGNQVDMNALATTEAGAAVVNALTKDYSKLMKAIDKKKGM